MTGRQPPPVLPAGSISAAGDVPVEFPERSVPEPGPGTPLRRSPPVPSPATVSQAPAGSEMSRGTAWWKDRRKEWPSWLLSLLLHLSLLLLLGSIVLSVNRHDGGFGTKLTRADVGSESGVWDGTEIEPDALQAGAGDFRLDANEPAWGAGDVGQSLIDIPQAGMNVTTPRGTIAPETVEKREPAAAVGRAGRGKAARGTTKKASAAQEQEIDVMGMLEGRETDARAKLVKSGGGTKASERAVELGLAWLARHQNPDGSWSFQHGPDDPGFLECPRGATGLALLAYLGAGYTHKKGDYRSQVKNGLEYLIRNMEVSDSGGWLLGTGSATMYVQGICAMALCEAFSLSKDPTCGARPSWPSISSSTPRIRKGGLAVPHSAGGRHVRGGLATDGVAQRPDRRADDPRRGL